MAMSRFASSDESAIEHFKDASTSIRTKKSTEVWVRVFSSWAEAREKNPDLLSYTSPDELNRILEQFYAEIRKKNGDQYEPACLRVMMAALDRHLQSGGRSFSICRDKEFRSSRSVLEGIARQLRQSGKGNLPNRARSLTNDEIDQLWNSGVLGTHNPRALINTVFITTCMGFAMRGREKHHEMKMEDFTFERDNKGNKYINYRYGNSKTNPSGLNFKPRKISGRLYENGGDRCPFRIFQELVKHRPIDMKATGPLYLAVIDRPRSDVWFKKTPMGVHKIHNLVKEMTKTCPALNLNKKITNHSIRKTAVRRLRENGFQKAEIKNVTGHASEAGLDAYDSGDDDELMDMSTTLLDGKRRPLPHVTAAESSSTTTTTTVSQIGGMFGQIQLEKQREISSRLNHPNFIPSFGLMPPTLNEEEPSRNFTTTPFPIGNSSSAPQHYHIAPCTINVYNNNTPAPEQKTTQRRRIRIIEDSDSDE